MLANSVMGHRAVLANFCRRSAVQLHTVQPIDADAEGTHLEGTSRGRRQADKQNQQQKREEDGRNFGKHYHFQNAKKKKKLYQTMEFILILEQKLFLSVSMKNAKIFSKIFNYKIKNIRKNF